MSQTPDLDIWFTTLGMVVIDELHFPSKKPVTDVIGGSGAYATLGARLFQAGSTSSTVGWMIRIGHDFPDQVKRQLERWNTTLFLQYEENFPSTRGCLMYHDELGTKAFKYLTPLLKILPSHLDHTPLLRSRSFHVLADPPELVSTVSELLLYRSRGGIAQRPLIVSEPLPSSCIPENYHAFLEAINHVDIFSPNHVEIAQLFGNEHPEVFNKPALENYATIFLTSGIGPSRCGAIVIRAAEYGCLITSTHQLPTWLPPYYANPLQAEADKSKVVDPTGAGNTFLGAFTLSYLKTHNLIEAAIYGTVGASFALEQIGIPVFEVDERGWETWNGEKVKGRVGGYRERVAVKKLLG